MGLGVEILDAAAFLIIEDRVGVGHAQVDEGACEAREGRLPVRVQSEGGRLVVKRGPGSASL